jgi:superfamily II DNA helicase RecQ
MREIPRWLCAIQKGIVSEEPLPQREKKRNPPMTISQQKLFARLRIWRDQQAKLEAVEPAMIVTTPLLKVIAKKRPVTLADIALVPMLRQWQISHYGTKLTHEVSKSPGFFPHPRSVPPLEIQTELPDESESQADD